MKLLAFADLHMGAGEAFGTAAYGPGSRLADQQAALDAIVQLALSENVDAALFASDLTHVNRPTPAVLRACQQPLERLAARGVPLIGISGNSHDVAHGDEPIALELFGQSMRLYRRPGVVDLESPNVGASIACLPWAPPSRLASTRDAGGRGDVHAEMAENLVAVAARMRSDIGDRPAVLMLHYSVAGGVSASGADAQLFNETVLPLADLQAQRWTAIVCGHLHSYQVLSADPLVFYPGPPAVVDFGEAGYPHGCVLLDIDDETGAVEHTFVEIPGRDFVTIDLDERTLDDLAADRPTPLIHGSDYRGCVARVRYAATPEQARRVDHRAIEQALYAAGAHKVYRIEPSIIRAERGRLDEILAQAVEADRENEHAQPIDAANLSPLQAIEAYIAANGLEGDAASALRVRTAAWLDGAEKHAEITEGAAA